MVQRVEVVKHAGLMVLLLLLLYDSELGVGYLLGQRMRGKKFLSTAFCFLNKNQMRIAKDFKMFIFGRETQAICGAREMRFTL